jgi:hypothetical protein
MMQVNVQLKVATGTVAASLGYESAVESTLKHAGLKMYPKNPGTQDSMEACLFRVPVRDQDEADRALALLRDHEGVERVGVAA